MTFLQRLLPTQGLICVAEARPGKGFRHFFYPTVEEAEKQIETLDAQGRTVYLAQARFYTDKINEATAHNSKLPWPHDAKDRMKVRSQGNAQWMRNFFFDIDCGEGKDYPSKKEAVAALKLFVEQTGLPFPAVVSSGNGLYAHWLLTEDMPAANWKVIARLLKNTATAYEFATDPVRTADTASVLRPPGTTNRKKVSKPVSLLRDMEQVSPQNFSELLKVAAKRKQVDVHSLAPPKAAVDANADFYSGTEATDIPKNAEQIAEKCTQLRRMRDTKGNMTEPLWYAGLGVLVFCEDGEQIANEWSKGHPEYDEKTTLEKITHRIDSDTGPTTCSFYGDMDPQGCLGCPHSGKIKSPIVLGRPEPEEKEIPEEECAPPQGYRRADGGLWHEQDEQWVQFYDQDLYPSQLAFDESLGYQVVTIRHHLPYEGWMEFTIRSSLVNDPKTLMTALWDNHVIVAGAREKKVMTAYIEGYMQRLQRQRKMNRLLCQMGWQDTSNGSIFVLGERVFRSDGTVETAPLAKNVPQVATAFHAKGELSTWTEATKFLDTPGAEPMAFALLAGGFGAPLMKFSGFEGAMVSLVGSTGVGKTMMLRMIQSVWGNHKDLMLLRDDTKNMMISRLGVHGTTPATIDEVTNIEGTELSDLVYKITQGRDKGRLTKNAVERSNLNHWNTLAVVTTNSSLVDKLSGAKHDATAEINRVFEYEVPRLDALGSVEATELYWTLDENYGVAGAAYVEWLVANEKSIKPGLEKVRVLLDKMADVRGEERYWSAIAATAIYGGMVARNLGLISFDVSRVMRWAANTIVAMRSDRDCVTCDAVSILGQFLDEFSSNRIVMGKDFNNAAGGTMIDPPRGSLYIRHETHTDRLFFPRTVFKAWLTRKFGSYTKVKNELKHIGALVDTNKRKTLGAGTNFSGAQQVCWEIDLKCQALGSVGFQLVEDGRSYVQAGTVKKGAVLKAVD